MLKNSSETRASNVKIAENLFEILQICLKALKTHFLSSTSNVDI